MSPLVSWLMCTNREDELLHRAIASCLNQTLQDLELVLVANGEHAAPMARALQARYGHDDRIRLFSTEIRYLNFSLSLGLHHTRAAFVARMDADDECMPDRLEIQYDFMQHNPDVTVLCAAYELVAPDGTVVGKVIPPRSDHQIRSQLRYRNAICHPTVMFRASSVKQAGGYLGGLHAEDYDLWSRLHEVRSCRFGSIDRCVLRYSAQPSGAARRSRTAYASMASSQFRCFLRDGDPRWLAGSALSAAKMLMRSRE
jgi:glycosyltransferase involved in cell wall biosynthesis